MRAGGVLHALDGRIRGQAALHGFAQAPLPAAIVGEHAIGFEHVAVLAGAGQVLVPHHLVERRLEFGGRGVEAGQLGFGIVGHQLGDDDARLVQEDMAERDALRHDLALDHRRQGLRELVGRRRSRHRAGDEMLSDDHGGRLQHLDILVGVFLGRAILHDEHAQDLAAPLQRHGEQRVIQLFARFGPVGEGRDASARPAR